MIYWKRNIGDTLLGIWKIEESEEELLSFLDIDEEIESILSIKNHTRVLEKLAIRVLLKQLIGDQKNICYLESGSPFFSDGSYQISISHTKGYVAIALNKEQKVGLDIEQITEKIKRVRSRIISQSEYIDLEHELVHLLLHWSAKEAMFKILRSEGVDFLKHLHVKPFSPQEEGFFRSRETKTPSNHCFDEVYYKVFEDFVLVSLACD